MQTLERITVPAERASGSYHIITWGCQMNDEDSEQLGLFMEAMGYRATPTPDSADVVLLNTCSVREKPEEKVWSELGRLRAVKAGRPSTIIGVCGCMAQVKAAQIRARAPQVDIILGTGNIGALPTLIREVRDGVVPGPRTQLGLPARRGAVVTEIPLRAGGRRAKLKAHVPIMYGCDKFCRFCIVPHTRGRERSRPTAEILAEIRQLAAGGTREVTLLGQTVNSYGKNLAEGRVPFSTLLREIDAIPGIERIRFTSPYPRDFRDDLITAIADLHAPCEHVHLPLQVADDDLLADMHRGYTVAEFEEILGALRARVPGIAVTTDIMLGYPGETEDQFENTMRAVERFRFDSAFMFAYSPRPDTPAATRLDQVPRDVKTRRLNELVALQNRITCEINHALVGSVHEVMVEGPSPRAPGRLTGLTRTNKTVVFDPPPTRRAASAWAGRFVEVEAVEGHLWGFEGTLASAHN